MIITVAGRLIDKADAHPARFPLSNRSIVERRMGEEFDILKPSYLISSGACGADLISLLIAGEGGVKRKMLLPFSRDEFRQLSVASRPGDWGRSFDMVYDQVINEGGVEILGFNPNDPDPYGETNRRIILAAEELSKKHSLPVTAVIVWDMIPRGNDDASAQFKKLAEEKRFNVKEIPTTK